MTFFDKLFTIKIKSNSESDNSVSNSHINCNACQSYRVIVFRECDRRGRKLLFDSSSVEKVTFDAAQVPCLRNSTSNCVSKRRNSDFVELSTTHAYRYKKPKSDVVLLGEMMFGSVSLVHKGRTSSKVHTIPSLPGLMFSSIVHAPGRYAHHQASSDRSVDSSYSSVNSLTSPNHTSWSDSNLYTRHPIQSQGATYPILPHANPVSTSSYIEENTLQKSAMHKSKNMLCLEGMTIDSMTPNCSFGNTDSCFGQGLNVPGSELHGCEAPSSCSSSACSGYDLGSYLSSNSGTHTGSLTSLRRRWMQNYPMSQVASDDSFSTKSRTKLGIAIIVGVSSLQRTADKFLFDHIIVVDSILNRLQATIESAYVQKQHFVDMLYSGYLEVKTSLCQLLNPHKIVTPVWLTVANQADSIRPHYAKPESSLIENIYLGLHLHEKRKIDVGQSHAVNVKHKFIHDFCEVLEKYDTKDTNFFVSTMVTVVLTHHFSWVHNMFNKKLPGQKFQRDAVSAQFSDLSGCMTLPQKTSRTIVSGGDGQRTGMAQIVQMLSYFIRCCQVTENTFDVDFDQVTKQNKDMSEVDNLDSGVDCMFAFPHAAEDMETSRKTSAQQLFSATEPSEQHPFTPTGATGKTPEQKSVSPEIQETARGKLPALIKPSNLYPDIRELAAMENVNLQDLDYEKDRTVFVEKFLNPDKINERVKKLLRIPDRARNFTRENEFDSSEKEPRGSMKLEVEKQLASYTEKRPCDVVFVLGENDRLAKTVTTKPELVDLEKEEWLGVSELAECCESENRTQQPDLNVLKGCEHYDASKMYSTLPMPRCGRVTSTRLAPASVFGEVNERFNPYQVIQGVVQNRSQWEGLLRLPPCHPGQDAHQPAETVCIIGDMSTWEVSLLSSHSYVIDRSKPAGVRVGMSKLVADRLESLSHLAKLRVAPEFCIRHLESMLEEIYERSLALAELLQGPELCSLDSLTQRLNIDVNDMVLVMTVATAHSPHLALKYGVSFL